MAWISSQKKKKIWQGHAHPEAGGGNDDPRHWSQEALAVPQEKRADLEGKPLYILLTAYAPLRVSFWRTFYTLLLWRILCCLEAQPSPLSFIHTYIHTHTHSGCFKSKFCLMSSHALMHKKNVIIYDTTYCMITVYVNVCMYVKFKFIWWFFFLFMKSFSLYLCKGSHCILSQEGLQGVKAELNQRRSQLQSHHHHSPQ